MVNILSKFALGKLIEEERLAYMSLSFSKRDINQFEFFT